MADNDQDVLKGHPNQWNYFDLFGINKVCFHKLLFATPVGLI